MATAPARQRQGAGRALLEAVLRRHRADGNSRFYLIATPAGRPLYEALGFQTVDDLTLYIAGHSEQFASH
jgi:GNAT superfamily N-acetyltransferase